MVRHKINKKTARIQGKHQKPKKTGTTNTIIIILIAILILGLFSNWTFIKDYNVKNVQNNIASIFHGNQQNKNQQEVIATVNGAPILTKDFEAQWKAIPAQTKLNMNRTELLQQMINEKLLLQKAAEEKIVVTDDEVDQFIKTQLAQTGITFDQYKQQLETQGTSIENLRAIYKKQLSVAKLFDKTITTQIEPSMEEIKEYYNKNKQQFYKGNQVTVRHILIQVSKNFNDSQALKRVKLIEKKLDEKNNSNFCDMVSNYTMDFGSKNNCGEYTFEKGVMVPEFENASFEMKPGERRVVKSSFGYHIILKVADIKAGYLKLDDILTEYPNQPQVKDLINQTIAQAKAKKIFDEYVKNLYNNAKIKYFDVELEPNSTSSLKN